MDQGESQLNDTIAENEWLREMVVDEVVTKDSKGQFTDEVKECVCKLLDKNVPMGNVGSVMEAVLHMVGKKATDLPAKSTVINWNVMRRSIAQQQLAEEMPQAAHLGLLSNETSKHGKKYEGFHAVNEKGQVYVLGLRNIVSKAGHDVLSTFQEILRDIDDRAMDSDTATAKQILFKITSTMSDRAATQIKFNKLLEACRKEILPEMVDNYETLTEAERAAVGKLLNFFCGLHALVHLAQTASKAILETEKESFADEPPILDRSFRKIYEPGTTRLVRTVCKALAEGADEKSGCHGSFLEYVRPTLLEDGFRRLPLEPFHGNRFNIIFQNAASVFYLADHITSFLEGGAENKLLKSVLHAIKVTDYLAGCKALGLVSFLVTMPLWTSIHVLDIGKYYQEIIDYILQATNRLDEFIAGDLRLSFANTHALQTSIIFQHLTAMWEHDGKVHVILDVMLPAMARLLQKIFSDHLEGGRWTNVPEDQREQLIGLPKHNKFSESVFGHLDQIMKQKPSITTIASKIFTHNKNGFVRKVQQKRPTFFYEATRSVKHVRKAFQQRQHDIQAAQRANVLKRLAQAEELQKKQLQKKEQQTLDIYYWGLWQSEGEVDETLATISTKTQKLIALKAQLNFRNNVLKQQPKDKKDKLFVFSQNKVPLTPEELTINLKKLIKESFEEGSRTSIHPPEASEEGAPLLVGKRIRHRFRSAEKDEEEWSAGKVISQVRGQSLTDSVAQSITTHSF